MCRCCYNTYEKLSTNWARKSVASPMKNDSVHCCSNTLTDNTSTVADASDASFIQFCDVINYYNVSQKNVPTLASCSFDKHGLILIIFGKRHDTSVQLSLSLHFYLLYLLLNNCDGNNVLSRYSTLVKQSSSFSRKHWTLSLQICVCQIVQLTTEFVDRCRNVCKRYEPLWPANSSSVSLTHGQAYHKTSLTKHLVNGEIDYMQAWGKKTSLWIQIKFI